MKKEYRIKKYSEIDAVYNKKLSKGDNYYSIYQSTDEAQDHFRFAMSIGRKYGNAVERNLAKRRIRMIVSELKDQFEKNKLFLIIIKPQSKNLTYIEMREKLIVLFKKSRLLESENAKTI